jgi:fructose-bisphosphate aldolase, class I
VPSLELETVAQSLVALGRGILAADESFPTIEKRFKALAISSTAESRLAYREALFTAPGLGEFISGAILFDETLRQKSSAGASLVTVLERQGIIPGIKVDLGTTELPNFPGEKVTRGLDGLPERLKEYRELGARFTKWRAVLTIGNGLPTRTCIESNAHALARFAALSQQADLVPIVEPEILMDGDHSIDRCEEAADATLRAVFDALADHRVQLEAMLLKPAMIVPGVKCPIQASDDEIAARTLRCLRRQVPAAVAGIVFLSGGQTPQQATTRLMAINRAGVAPWALTFSFGRALQDPALSAWRGNPENVPAAQVALLDRARQNSAAVRTPPRDAPQPTSHGKTRPELTPANQTNPSKPKSS